MMVKNLQTRGNWQSKGNWTGFLIAEAIEEACKGCLPNDLANDSWELLVQAYEKAYILDEDETCFLSLRLKSEISSPTNRHEPECLVIPYQRIDQAGNHWLGRLEVTHKGRLLSVLDREAEVSAFYAIMGALQEKSPDCWAFEEKVLWEDPLNSYLAYQLGKMAF